MIVYSTTALHIVYYTAAGDWRIHSIVIVNILVWICVEVDSLDTLQSINNNKLLCNWYNILWII